MDIPVTMRRKPTNVHITDRDIGGSHWVCIRARMLEWMWLTPEEARELGEYLVAVYPKAEGQP